MPEQARIFKELGKIFFRFPDDSNEPIQKRIIGIQNSEVVKIQDLHSKKIDKIPIKELINSYTELKPDGIMVFNIVSMGNQSDQNYFEDVMVCLYRDTDLTTDGRPYCVCRQCTIDVFYNLIRTDINREVFGMSLSQDNCPAEIDFDMILACAGIISSVGVNIYRTDTLDDILSMIRTTEFDQVLYTNLIKRYNHRKITNPFITPDVLNTSLDGYCRNLKMLLEMNDFMYDFYTGFNITPIKFKLNLYERNGVYCLSEEDKKTLSDLYRINMADTVVTKYSREIDFDRIKMSFVIVKDPENELWIIAYTTNGAYLDYGEGDAAAEATKKLMNRLYDIVDHYDKYGGGNIPC